MRKLIKGIDEKIGITEFYQKFLSGYMVPENLNFWYTLGSVCIFFFLIQVVTGVLLLMYYIPSVDKAFESVLFITNNVPFGWLIRRIHAVAAHLFVIALFLHMLSVIIMGSYKKPREINWITGCLLFALVLTACLSGYLLPWSQLSYWATTVATSIPETIPYIGKWLVFLIRGGEKITQITLSRFFALHVVIIPSLIFLLITIHIIVMRRVGISYPPGTDESKVKKIPFFPYFFLKDLRSIYLFFALTLLIVFFFPQLVFPKDAMVKADPLETPEKIKPEWYFLFNYQLLKIVPNEFLGIFIQILLALVILLLPFIDRNPERRIWKRPLFFMSVIFFILFYIFITVWGYLS
ncbi:MAG: cytochrome bc complex cytochrome b subunit [Candidatus Hydrothermales bacterium]